jgi:dipicolinate synthase subunit B
MEKIGFGITSSFCNLDFAIEEMIKLKQLGYDIIPITSAGVIEKDTRFGKGLDFKKKIEDIAENQITSTIEGAEKFGSIITLSLLVVAPATGNFIGKLAHGITDTPVTMASKATLRNNKPVVLAISTNDGFGLNGENIMKLLNTKNIYLVPFTQDDYINKPKSLIADYSLIVPTVEKAMDGEQYQPIIAGPAKCKVKK